jgi:coenzyme F420-reducing hydrogenase delta subunit
MYNVSAAMAVDFVNAVKEMTNDIKELGASKLKIIPQT